MTSNKFRIPANSNTKSNDNSIYIFIFNKQLKKATLHKD